MSYNNSFKNSTFIIKGLKLPILYNTNGYDTLETIKLLDGYIEYLSSKYLKSGR